ncbi:hypothetical protein WJX72_002509 [[Myrmecia] bisecta]|uniref:COX assembly mitochondrial protein n=1 Tax=[Myrmecia] bisecta TaxID=41462 RepID=A0AAW1R6E1_9CHLO
MGAGSPLKVNTKKMSRNKKVECFEEMQALFACMTRYSGTDFEAGCATQRSALTTCAEAAARKPKVKNTINYHLQRLSKHLHK